MRLPIVLVLSMCLAAPAHAAPKAKLWPFWDQHDPSSTATVDHGPWASFLDSYLQERDDGANLVAYGDVSSADKEALDAYVRTLAGLPIRSYGRDEQMAYWINLYNALTVQVILDHYPVDSIRDIDISGFFSDGPWGKELVTIEGQDVSLDDIEHRILRPIWRDPRIHYAVNCASIGCPDLQPEPFRAADLDAQLDAAAEGYVNDPRGAVVDGDDLVVSSIYEWFQEDFGGSDRGVIEHLRTHADADLEATLDRFSSFDDDRYDWSLNDAS